MSNARELIEKIQREYGFDPTSGDRLDGTAGLSRMQQGYGNALQLLSRELYNYDGHFLLELLQNADDNSYPDGVEPTLRIEVSDREVVVTNNEIGFSNDNVSAICHVGESTKQARKVESIGEKGIGFKAVFKVSDKPEIHSNGFHFCFDIIKFGNLGMVSPSWVPESQHRGGAGETVIVLPFQSALAIPIELADQFAPELTLFFRRIRRLKLSDERARISIELHREDAGNISTVTRTATTATGSQTETIKFFRQERVVSVGEIADEKRDGVNQTTVVVAVPLDAEGGVDGSVLRKAFAFLPIRDSGLPFVVHADFVLNTSREDVVRGRAWNIKLRDELAVALADSVIAMQQSGSLGQSALRVLRKPESIADTFIRPIMELAIKRLKGMRCVPGGSSVWELPSSVLRPDRYRLCELIDAGDIQKLLRKVHLSSEATGIGDGLDLLNVVHFSLTDLLRGCKDQTWLCQRDSKWLVGLYRKLEPLAMHEAFLQQIRACPIFLLSNRSYASVAEGPVFRSLKRKSKYGFEDALRVLDASVLNAAESGKGRNQVEQFLGHVGIRDADVVTIIEKHIIPAHAHGEEIPDIPTLVAHARYLRDFLEDYKSATIDKPTGIRALGGKFWVLVMQSGSGSRTVRRAEELYVGDSYGDPNQLQQLFAGSIDDRVVGNDYLHADKAPSPEGWRSLFKALGARELPRVVQKGHDWFLSEELAELIGAQDAKRNRKLLELLDSNWESWTKEFVCVQYLQETSLVRTLRAMQVPIRGGGCAAVDGLYCYNEHNRAVFQDSVGYILQKLSTEELKDALRIVKMPSIERVLERLDELAVSPPSNCLRDAGRLYKYLDQYWEGNEEAIKAHFEGSNAVFHRSDKKVIATSLPNCCWHVPPRLQDYCLTYGVDHDWEQHKDFFKKLEIRERLDGADWIAVLLRLSEEELESSEVTELAQQVYLELEGCLAREWEEGGDAPDWIDQARGDSCILTNHGDWWHNDEDVFAEDDTGLGEVFADCLELRFIGISADRLPKFRRLIKALEIAGVSSAERSPPDWETGVTHDSLQDRLRAFWPTVVRILFSKHQIQYEEAKSNGRLMHLQQLAVREFSPLEMVVTLAKVQRTHRFDCYLDENAHGRCLLVDTDNCTNWMAIAREIGKYLRIAESETDLFTMVLQAGSEDHVAKILHQKRIQPLPQGEMEELAIALRADQADPLEEDGSTSDRTEDEAMDDTVDDSLEASVDGSLDDSVHPNKSTPTTRSPAGNAPAVITNRGGSREVGIRSALPESQQGVERAQTQSVPSIAPTNSDHGKPRSDKPQRRPSRFISYVEPDSEPLGEQKSGGEQQQRREQIDEAAIERVVAQERSEGRVPKVQPHTNPGFDIDSCDSNGNTLRYIEVKGLGGEWGERGVTMSHMQFDWARQHKDRSWLYVVEFASNPQRQKLWRIQDPASKANKFGFDHGWRDASDEPPPPPTPGAELVPGAKWRFQDGEIGEVLSVTSNGAIFTVKARRGDGATVSRSGLACGLAFSIVRD